MPKHTLPSMIHALGIPYLNTYFILTTKHIIMAIPYGPEDGIRWRLKYKMYEEAFKIAKDNVSDWFFCFSQTHLFFRQICCPKQSLVKRTLVDTSSKVTWRAIVPEQLQLICQWSAERVKKNGSGPWNSLRTSDCALCLLMWVFDIIFFVTKSFSVSPSGEPNTGTRGLWRSTQCMPF